LIYIFRLPPVGEANPFDDVRFAKARYNVNVKPGSVMVDKLPMEPGVTGYSTPASVSVVPHRGKPGVSGSSRGPKWTVQYVRPDSSPENSDPNDETYEPPG
jgi:hypothetical protein